MRACCGAQPSNPHHIRELAELVNGDGISAICSTAVKCLSETG